MTMNVHFHTLVKLAPILSAALNSSTCEFYAVDLYGVDGNHFPTIMDTSMNTVVFGW